jgi:predicted dehydrogenase
METHAINAVVICTDPLSHRAYASWALDMGLDILMDKPITTRRDAANDADQARGIEEDMLALVGQYRVLQTSRQSCFLLCAHRRYHPAIQFVEDRIREVAEQTGCPATNVMCYHSDGQWRMPSEMVTQSHHSYHDGHGKVSHSGYHFLDCIHRFALAGRPPQKAPDTVRAFASFIRPAGLLTQLNETDYLRIFGDEYLSVRTFSDAELAPLFGTYGEIDADVVFTYVRGNVPLLNASLSLLHNGFSRRSWMHPGTDLYKGNGRVKHEEHRVHSGPFQCVYIRSFQAKDRHERCDEEDCGVGGNNHCEITVFRNSDILGGKAVETLSLADLPVARGYQQAGLLIEQIKEEAILEFFGFLRGRIPLESLRSNIDTHIVPTRMMSAVYLSHVRLERGENPVVSVRLDKDEL